MNDLSEIENELINLFLNKQYLNVEEKIWPILEQYQSWLNGWKILSDTLLIQGKDAKPAALKALALNSQDAEEHCYYGLILKNSGDLLGAAHAFQTAITLKQDYAAAYNNLGIVKKDLGDVAAGITYYRKALQINPSYAACFSNLLFCLSHYEKCSPKDLYQEHIKFSVQYERPASWIVHKNVAIADKPLKVGFVSADFRNHSVAYCLLPLLEYLAKSTQLTLFAYYNHTIIDDYTNQLKPYFKGWRNITEASDDIVCNWVREDGVDILVDLSGHTAGNRLTVFAKKPAPIQLTWFGYLSTTGLKAMDYYLADIYLAPPKQFDADFSEKLIQLPVNANFLPMPDAPDVQTLPALKNGFVTFGCFNRPSKISAAAIQLWSSLLNAVPNSRLLLGAMPHSDGNDSMIESFLTHGISKERLIFCKRGDMQTYLALHHQVDICLDTMPSSGITTTFHAAWMGVPTLCIAGNSVTSRGAMAIMSHLNCHTFIVDNATEFVKLGVDWANHLTALQTVRFEMRERLNRSAIANPAILANALESAFRKIWHVWCKRKSKQSFIC